VIVTRRLCALLAVLPLLAGLVVATPAQAAPGPIRVMTFNICGNVCRKGEVTKTAGNVAYQVTARRVGVTFLQEVCYSQFLAIRKRLLRRGYHGVFAASTSGGKCDDHDRKHGSGFGNAILVRGPVSGRVVRRLPIPSPVRAEARTLLGTSARLGGRWVFLATTHTAPSRTTRDPWPRSSGPEALTEPTPLSTRATVLVTLAATGGRPAASSAG